MYLVFLFIYVYKLIYNIIVLVQDVSSASAYSIYRMLSSVARVTNEHLSSATYTCLLQETTIYRPFIEHTLIFFKNSFPDI